MNAARIVLPLGFAVVFALAALTVVPRGYHAGLLLSVRDDPIALTDNLLDRTFHQAAAEREIGAALANNDIDLADSFVALARDRGVTIDPALEAKVAAAKATSALALRTAENFVRGFVVGEPDDLTSLAGTAVGDLFVFGDVRDIVREGVHAANGEEVDGLILGLAGVGLAITAGTYMSFAAGAPARVGVSVVKAAAKGGRMTARMGRWIGRSLGEIVDWGGLGRAVTKVSWTQPGAAVRAARESVKVAKADGLIRLAGDVGRVQSKAGTKAALDALRIAQGPQDVARLARLAETHGGATRAILKLGGRAAIVLTAATFNLSLWVFGALLTLFGFVSSLKKATERTAERVFRRRRYKRALRRARMAALPAAV